MKILATGFEVSEIGEEVVEFFQNDIARAIITRSRSLGHIILGSADAHDDDIDLVLHAESRPGIGQVNVENHLIRTNSPTPVYILRHGCNLERFVQINPQIGFSLVPPMTDASVLEIARRLPTSTSELEKARAFFESLGFTVVDVPDGPGLVQARIIACLANEAFSALSEGVADAATIDTAMRLGLNYPRGPLEWAELIGLGSVLAILEGLQSEYGEERYRPHPLLKRLVATDMNLAQFEAWKQGK